MISLLLFVAVFCLVQEVESLSMSTAETKNIVVITHAAGRMGKLLALQIHEDPDLQFDTVRAVCRTEEEAYNVQCDLGGILMGSKKKKEDDDTTTTNNKPQPIPCDWLETVVVKDDNDNFESNLKKVFEDASAAVLCDASHNELVWQNDENEFCVIVPAQDEQNALSSRLLQEIEAASSSTTLDRVVLRSSMGLASDEEKKSQTMMGGEVALSGPRKAEQRLKECFDTKKGRSCVVLRLGALTDDPGMVPLVFDGSEKDALLFARYDDDSTTLHPPILSRADAARVSTHLLKKPWFGPQYCTLDCAWKIKFGRNSAGTEEAFIAASQQNLAADILTATAMKETATATAE